MCCLLQAHQLTGDSGLVLRVLRGLGVVQAAEPLERRIEAGEVRTGTGLCWQHADLIWNDHASPLCSPPVPLSLSVSFFVMALSLISLTSV